MHFDISGSVMKIFRLALAVLHGYFNMLDYVRRCCRRVSAVPCLAHRWQRGCKSNLYPQLAGFVWVVVISRDVLATKRWKLGAHLMSLASFHLM